MRPVLHGDVTSVARALLLVQESDRIACCARIFEQADLAELHVLQHGRLHPSCGNGSLMAAARCYPLADEPNFDSAEYCRCFIIVLATLLDRQQTKVSRPTTGICDTSAPLGPALWAKPKAKPAF